MKKAQSYQKQWYDKCDRERYFKPGDYVIILLPTLPLSLQRSGKDCEKNGKVHKLLHMNAKRNKSCEYDYKKFVQSSSNYLMKNVREEEFDDDIVTWDGGEDALSGSAM